MNNNLDEILQELQNQWRELTSQYGIDDVPLMIVSVTEFISIIVECYYVQEGGEIYKYAVEEVSKLERKGSTLVNKFIFSIDDEDNAILACECVYMLEETLYFMIIRNPSVDAWREWANISFRHEIGHILVNREKYVGLPIRELINLRVREINDEKQMLDDILALEGDEYVKAYHSRIPSERDANEKVGLQVEDMINCDHLI